MKPHDQHARIALRLRTLRDAAGLTQTDLASSMGIESRQSIAAIEAGDRRISPEELVRAAEALNVEPDTFLDPFRLVGEAKFNFRATDVPENVLVGFQEQAGRWIATFRELAARYGEPACLLGMKLELSETSSFEEAAASAEALAAQWGLGDVPAGRLEDAIESRLGALVLHVDAPRGISGAASHLPKYHTILVNRREPVGRRSFDLAHELFHILTWDAMPPRWVEPREVAKKKGNRVEYLADNFAAALLIPSAVAARRWADRGDEDLAAWLSRTAAELLVSTPSLLWRLVNVDLLPRREAELLQHAAHTPGTPAQKVPKLFSRRFIALVARAVDDGHLSLRRAASLLALSVADLGELCAAYGFPLSYDLVG